MPSNVRVAVRVRPLLKNEVAANHQVQLMKVDRNSNCISLINKENNTKKNF